MTVTFSAFAASSETSACRTIRPAPGCPSPTTTATREPSSILPNTGARFQVSMACRCSASSVMPEKNSPRLKSSVPSCMARAISRNFRSTRSGFGASSRSASAMRAVSRLLMLACDGVFSGGTTSSMPFRHPAIAPAAKTASAIRPILFLLIFPAPSAPAECLRRFFSYPARSYRPECRYAARRRLQACGPESIPL